MSHTVVVWKFFAPVGSTRHMVNANNAPCSHYWVTHEDGRPKWQRLSTNEGLKVITKLATSISGPVHTSCDSYNTTE
jgi:hypothetical protein